MRYGLCCALSLCLGLLTASCVEYQDKDSYYKLGNEGPAFSLRILTFNILSSLDLLSVSDGYPVWGQRRGAMMSFIEDTDADVVGLQESAITQADQLRSALNDRYETLQNLAYTSDTLLLVKKDGVEILEKGYWLLEDIRELRKIRRLALWAKLRETESGREFMVTTAHIDAQDDNKRRQIQLLMQKLSKEQANGAPLFLFGDFNATATDKEIQSLLASGWKDSFLGTVDIPTFPVKKLSRRIDHVFYFGPEVSPQSWTAKDYAPNEVQLSDHLPVVVDFAIEAAP